MFVSLFLIFLLTVGGASLTYLFAKDAPLLWRVCAGNVVGSAIFGLVCFLAACFFGFTATTISLSFLISLAPLFVFLDETNRANLLADWRRAKGKLENTNFKRILRFAYYVFFFVLFYFFFERAMLETAQGIFTGASQNLGDLPFHLGAIFSFTDGQNFPPENPSYAFAKFSYPFMADLITASFVKFGAGVREAMLVQNVFLAFSLLVVLERFTFKLTDNRLAGKIAPVLLFFCGGLGFVWFVKDYWQQAQSFFEFVWHLSLDYTIRDSDKGEKFRWGNSLVVLFITQRSLLLGMPLTIVVLQKLWEIFATENTENIEKEKKSPFLPFSLSPFLIGLLAGTLPLIHVHSLAVLFVVGASLFFFRLDKWREWLWFAIGVAVVAVPELVWVMTGSATRLTEFVGWHFGWDKRTDNFVWFWLKNLGAFIPLLIFGIYFIFNVSTQERADAKENGKQNQTTNEEQPTKLLLFYLPFVFLFLVSNSVKLAPWEWDNIKVLIYWFVGSLPIVALVLARLWVKDKSLEIATKKLPEKINHEATRNNAKQNKFPFVLFRVISWFRFFSGRIVSFLKHEKTLKAVAVCCLIILTFSGALDVWHTVSNQINNKVFHKDAVALAEQIKQKTAPNAFFLNAPTYNSAVVLSGRRSLMRYSGHLLSYGIDYTERENDVKKIYAGDATSEIFLKKYGIEYVVVSPEEKSNLTVNEEFFRRFPVVAEAGQYRVYQIKK